MTVPAGSYTLTADIDLTGSGFTTVPEFTGSLDGAGHTVRGVRTQPLFTDFRGKLMRLTVDGSDTTITGDGVGAICVNSYGGVFEDVVVKGYTIKHKTASKGLGNGLFASTAYDGTTLTRCATGADSVVSQNGKSNNHNGGFVGCVKKLGTGVTVATFNDCTNNAKVVQQSSNSVSFGGGGFVGMASFADYQVPKIYFNRCVNNGQVSMTTKGYVGGFVGWLSGISNTAEKSNRIIFTDCSNFGTISTGAATGAAGGFIGCANNSSSALFARCANRGEINAEQAERAGGFVGYFGGYMSRIVGATDCTFLDCANFSPVRAKLAAGFAADLSTNTGWGTGVYRIDNSANYGEVTGPTNAQLVAKFVSAKSGSGSDNCYGCTVDPGLVTNAYTFSFTHYQSKTNSLSSLNSVASAKANYVDWVYNGAGYPVLSIFADTEFVPPPPEHIHAWGAWVTNAVPTCTVAGERAHTCGGAGCSDPAVTETEVIPALGHLEVVDPGVAPTATATGLSDGKYCGRCGVVLVAQTVIPALGVSGDISTGAQFFEQVTSGATGTFKLLADIDLAGTGYTTISNFAGTINGNGHTLTGIGQQPLFDDFLGTMTNIVINGNGTTITEDGTAAICRKAYGAKFVDVTVKGYTVKHAANKSSGNGLFVGTAYDGTTFLRCTTWSDCTVSLNSKSNNHNGGFVGMVKSLLTGQQVASFTDCTNQATIVQQSSYNVSFGGGGFVGHAAFADAAVPCMIFKRCVNKGAVSMTGNGEIGGFVGMFAGGNDKTKGNRLYFLECLNTGTITASGGDCAGGFLGIGTAASSALFERCVNRAAISASSAAVAGGLVGSFGGTMSNVSGAKDITVRNSANYGNVSAKTAGGLVGKFDTMVGWQNGVISILNCGNYGTVTATDYAGDLLAYYSCGYKAGNKSDNCFGLTANGPHVVTNATYPSAFTLTNCVNAAQSGYSASSALSSLGLVANGVTAYSSWSTGSTGHPELIYNTTPTMVFSYEAYFVDWDGKVLKYQKNISSGGTAKAPSDPTRAGYTFVGWDTKLTGVKSNLIITALYTSSADVMFDPDNGETPMTLALAAGDGFAVPADPTRAGYTFVGWSLDGVVVDVVPIAPAGGRTYKAVWQVAAVHFDPPVIDAGKGGFEISNGSLTLKVSQPVENAWYTLFAADTLSEPFMAVKSVRYVAAESDLAFDLPTTGTSKFATIAISGEQISVGTTLQ